VGRKKVKKSKGRGVRGRKRENNVVGYWIRGGAGMVNQLLPVILRRWGKGE